MEVDSAMGVYFLLVVTFPPSEPSREGCASALAEFLGMVSAFFFLKTSW